MTNRSRKLALVFLTLLTAAPVLGACHATAGAGEDISRAGDAIERSAEKHTP